jgi:hypothetical protein
MYSSLLPRTFRLVEAFCFGVGSLSLMAGGIFTVVKMNAREDDPEVWHYRSPWKSVHSQAPVDLQSRIYGR